MQRARGKQAAPLRATPVRAAPLRAAPLRATPVRAAPVRATPVRAAPVRATPVRAAPVRAAPLRAVPLRAAPVRAAPLRAAPLRATPVRAALSERLTCDAVVHAVGVENARLLRPPTEGRWHVGEHARPAAVAVHKRFLTTDAPRSTPAPRPAPHAPPPPHAQTHCQRTRAQSDTHDNRCRPGQLDVRWLPTGGQTATVRHSTVIDQISSKHDVR